MRSGEIIFLVLVLGVTALGFLGARWRRANLGNIEEWALGGRRFGTLISWFLLGGDMYTAYTFVAVPALIYGVGALGFYAMPYATLAYPIVFVVLARFYTIARKRGYLTAADFVRDRFGSRSLELAIAITGILATTPYIALQLVGMKTAFMQLGGAFALGGGAVALAVAFAILAAYTYTSGLRAPALISLVKDSLIYIVVIAAIAVIPAKLGGWAHVFASAQTIMQARPHPASLVLAPNMAFAYATMCLGSALSVFLYPHAITSVLAAKSATVVKRNAALLPLYSLVLGGLCLLGVCAVSAGIVSADTNAVVPMLFAKFFPDWFAGVAYAAIAIGALVPAAIMAIGAANLFASNVFRQFSPQRDAGETRTAKYLCLFMCAVALALVLLVREKFSVNFQLIGAAWMLQVFPAVVLGLYTRRLHPRALLLGWIAGMGTATAMVIADGFKGNVALPLFGTHLVGFVAFYAIVVNVVVSFVAGYAFDAMKVPRGSDGTAAADYA